MNLVGEYRILLENNEIVVGNPARFLKKNSPIYNLDIFKNI